MVFYVLLLIKKAESKNIYTDFSDYNIVAGYVYEYDVDKNKEGT